MVSEFLRKTAAQTAGLARPVTRAAQRTYLILSKGPLASGKLLVFKTWIPASWSPSNGVTVPGHPAVTACAGSANHIPRWAIPTGTGGTPRFRMKVSSLKIPVTSTTPSPLALVVRSPWYHAGTKGAFGVVMTKSVKSVFAGSLNTSTCIFCTCPRSLIVTRPRAPALRQGTAPADLTIPKTVLSFAAASANGTIPIVPMATATAMLAENKHLFIGVLLNLDGAGNGCVATELTGERVATFKLNITSPSPDTQVARLFAALLHADQNGLTCDESLVSGADLRAFPFHRFQPQPMESE